MNAAAIEEKSIFLSIMRGIIHKSDPTALMSVKMFRNFGALICLNAGGTACDKGSLRGKADGQ